MGHLKSREHAGGIITTYAGREGRGPPLSSMAGDGRRGPGQTRARTARHRVSYGWCREGKHPTGQEPQDEVADAAKAAQARAMLPPGSEWLEEVTRKGYNMESRLSQESYTHGRF